MFMNRDISQFNPRDVPNVKIMNRLQSSEPRMLLPRFMADICTHRVNIPVIADQKEKTCTIHSSFNAELCRDWMSSDLGDEEKCFRGKYFINCDVFCNKFMEVFPHSGKNKVTIGVQIQELKLAEKKRINIRDGHGKTKQHYVFTFDHDKIEERLNLIMARKDHNKLSLQDISDDKF